MDTQRNEIGDRAAPLEVVESVQALDPSVAAMSDEEWLVECDGGTTDMAADCPNKCQGTDDNDDGTIEHQEVHWDATIDRGCRSKLRLFTEYAAVEDAERLSHDFSKIGLIYRIRNARTGEIRDIKTAIEERTVRTADSRVDTTIVTHRWTVDPADKWQPAPEHLPKVGRYYLKRPGTSDDFLRREVTTSYGSREVNWDSFPLHTATSFVQLPAALKAAFEQKADLYDATTGKTLSYKALVAWGALHMRGSKPNAHGARTHSEPDFTGIGKMVRKMEAKGDDAFTALSELVGA